MNSYGSVTKSQQGGAGQQAKQDSDSSDCMCLRKKRTTELGGNNKHNFFFRVNFNHLPSKNIRILKQKKLNKPCPWPMDETKGMLSSCANRHCTCRSYPHHHSAHER